MAYYLKPPRGVVPLNRLLELAYTRMIFLFKLISLKENLEEFLDYLEKYAEYSECLIEGNAKDRISHFMLRLACMKSNRRRVLFVEAETLLFKLRLQQMSAKEKHQMVRTVMRHLAELNVCDLGEANHYAANTNDVVTVLHHVVQQIRAYNLFQLGNCELENSDVFINVPFQYVLALVSTRSVHLNRGIAFVFPDKMHKLLELLFSLLLTAEIEDGSSNYLGMSQEDERLHYLCELLGELFEKNELRALPVAPVNSIASYEIDNLSRHFPPCMRLLHTKLRQHHRLQHAARIEYSLYLKEIGLPVMEAVKFWENEYSKPSCFSGAGQASKCSHQWKKDKARYTYSIRHLYGLEGSKRCYAARSCSTLQGMALGPLEEGGCPFKHFESETLISCLQKWGTQEAECKELASIAAKEQYTLACSRYLKSRTDSSAMQDTIARRFTGCFNSSKRSYASGNLKSEIDICLSAGKYRCVSNLDSTGRKPIVEKGDVIGQLPNSENSLTKDTVLANNVLKSNFKVSSEQLQNDQCCIECIGHAEGDLGKSFSKPSEFFFRKHP